MPLQNQKSVISSPRRKPLPLSPLHLPPVLHLRIQWKAVNFLPQSESESTLPLPSLRPPPPAKDSGRHRDQAVNLLPNRHNGR